MNSNPAFHSFESRDALADALAQRVADRLREAIEQRGQATLVVSGGSTPMPFFKALKAYDLPWEHVTISVADERWVDAASDESNEKLVRDYLLHERAQYLSLAPAVEGESLEEGAARLQKKLGALPHALDVVILGMGEDGHTASLFPHHPALGEGLNKESDALCLTVTDSPKPPAERVTMTAKLLCHARHLLLHITGDAKREVYEQAMQSDEEGAFPIASVLRQSQSSPEIYWAA